MLWKRKSHDKELRQEIKKLESEIQSLKSEYDSAKKSQDDSLKEISAKLDVISNSIKREEEAQEETEKKSRETSKLTQEVVNSGVAIYYFMMGVLWLDLLIPIATSFNSLFDNDFLLLCVLCGIAYFLYLFDETVGAFHELAEGKYRKFFPIERKVKKHFHWGDKQKHKIEKACKIILTVAVIGLTCRIVFVSRSYRNNGSEYASLYKKSHFLLILLMFVLALDVVVEQLRKKKLSVEESPGVFLAAISMVSFAIGIASIIMTIFLAGI